MFERGREREPAPIGIIITSCSRIGRDAMLRALASSKVSRILHFETFPAVFVSRPHAVGRYLHHSNAFVHTAAARSILWEKAAGSVLGSCHTAPITPPFLDLAVRLTSTADSPKLLQDGARHESTNRGNLGGSRRSSYRYTPPLRLIILSSRISFATHTPFQSFGTLTLFSTQVIRFCACCQSS